MPRLSRRTALFLPLLCAGFLFIIPVHNVSADDDRNDTDSCTGTIWDADGNAYGTVKVGDQCWMGRNMNVGTIIAQTTTQTDNGVVEKYCYGNDPDNCATDGGLYQWDEAMQYSTTEGARGICPAGWHIPTDAQQYALENYLKDTGQTCDANRNGAYDCSTAGTKLNSGGTSGLNIPLAGYRTPDGSFSSRYSGVYLWSSLQDESTTAWDRRLYSSEARVYRSANSKTTGLSMRCLKDNAGDPTDALSIEILPAIEHTLATFTPIVFTLRTTLPKIASGTTLKNRMHIRMADAFVTMRYDRTKEDGMTLWKGIYNRPTSITGPYRLAGTLETADCLNDVGTRLSFAINDPIPGIHTVSAALKDDETVTKMTFVPAQSTLPTAKRETPPLFSRLASFLRHFFGLKEEETQVGTETQDASLGKSNPVYASLEEPNLAVPEARKLCRVAGDDVIEMTPRQISKVLTAGASRAGWNIALSGNASVLALSRESPYGGDPGAFIFDWNGSEWVQRGGVLIPPGNGYWYDGVGLSSDGNTFAYGKVYLDGWEGGVYIYDWDGAKWIQRGSVVTPNQRVNWDSFGASISFSADTKVMVVGGWANVWTFDWNGSVWVERNNLKGLPPSPEGTPAYGNAAISADAKVLAAGCGSGSTLSSVYIYDLVGSTWVRRNTIVGPSGSAFGSDVALSSNGNLLAVGSTNFVYLYDRSGSGWIRRGDPLSVTGGGGSFGKSVDISSDGGVLVTSDFSYPRGDGSTGATYTYKLPKMSK